MNRILEIDEANLLAVVEPNVITGDLQDAVERVGLFYPPDPASLRQSAIGGNVAECAGGPRAFKYGVTQAVRARPRSRAADGGDHPHRRQGREERRRLRPDAPARRLGRHARDHHARSSSADPEAAGAGDAAARRFRASSTRSTPSRAGARARRAGVARAGRSRVARRGRASSGRRCAGAGGHRGAAAASKWTAWPSWSRGSRARRAARAARPARPKSCAPPTTPSATSSGACGASCRRRCKMISPRQVQPRRRRAEGARFPSCSSCRAAQVAGSADDSVFRPRRRRQHPRQHHAAA